MTKLLSINAFIKRWATLIPTTWIFIVLRVLSITYFQMHYKTVTHMVNQQVHHYLQIPTESVPSYRNLIQVRCYRITDFHLIFLVLKIRLLSANNFHEHFSVFPFTSTYRIYNVILITFMIL